jgi:hypothetical protein
VEPRVLLEPLLGAYAALATPLSAAPKDLRSAHSVVTLVRAVHRLITALPRAAAREYLPQLFAFVLSALDYRWRIAPPPAVVATVDAAATEPVSPATLAHLAACDVAGSLVEVELLPSFAALLLKLSEAQVRPLLLKLLQWSAAEPGDIRADLILVGDPAAAAIVSAAATTGAAGAESPFFVFATLARRITLMRLVESCTAVLKSVFLPLFGNVLPALAAELSAGAQAAAVAAAAAAGQQAKHKSGKAADKAKTSRASASDPTATTKKRVRIQEPASDESSGGSRDGDNDDDEEEDSAISSLVDEGASDVEDESGAASSLAASAAGAGGVVASLHNALHKLDAIWCPPSSHSPATGAAHALVATSPHALRCVSLAALRSALLHDTAPDPEGFMARGGRERLELVLRPITSQFELPVANAAAAGGAVGVGVPGGAAGYEAFVDAYLLPLVGNLVVALRRDTLWKQLNTAVLLLTRDRRPRVRLAALRASGAVFERGGDEALVLLPESLPFLSELLHDEDRGVEVAAHKLLEDLERSSGEDLQAFLS